MKTQLLLCRKRPETDFVSLIDFDNKKGTRRNCDGGYDIDGLRVSLIKNPRR